MTAELTGLGLTSFFTTQLSVEELSPGRVARIVQVHRSRVIVSDGSEENGIALGGGWFELSTEQRPTVGDWVILDVSKKRIERLLTRKSVVQRVVPGSKTDIQLIAANIDTLFIVTSCNEEFSKSRLERYLTLAAEAGVDPVIVFTKADLVDDADKYVTLVKEINADTQVELVNALDPDTLDGMRKWILPGTTIAIVGSSGVGKSTLVNTLSGAEVAKTGAIREQDTKGRHTTTHRELFRLPGGGLIIDVPGMRELKVGRRDRSSADIFADIETLAGECKFSNCAHVRERHCAVRQAIRSGNLDARRLNSYRKLKEEEAQFAGSVSTQKGKPRLASSKKWNERQEDEY